ncbi:hypothetical protein CLAFUW4_09050 [Fulvia fulva]|uniref:Glycosyltransferase family 31 protein n=1 Tax=Passalora fulva TaxID=5499 RepID=A0A9Q8PG61_PASFU|nr:uncharacterized protein CLAFUR5_09161 [Fulvia fulva]KAK4613225.1 hypothetical protein CLAFUR4_09056 [Fulvia fulva]KAK4614980.1 hypothetical protein CLAFUR0_09048 [Fulvia fulva]UJO21888.1 hypothetical protein CLAFUR5_09161 [Fulvia fulva]WPV20584.1 hypothetical protein CLAFUW4_09050 [Fulvia fulva]WPV34887.1 hypothetical protein CLAFUW7_09051 [Fulvia fulva]
MSGSAILGGRGVTLARLAVIFLLIVGLFLLRDTWFPKAEEAYNKHLGDAKWLHANHKEQESSNKEDSKATPVIPGTALEQPEHFDQLAVDSQLNIPPETPAASPYHKLGDPVPDHKNETECRHLPGADKVLVMLKTGATELYAKLPTHFVTTFQCIPNFSIYSDLEQTFGDVQIYDAIKPVSKKIREEHEDFQLYREIQKWEREGQDLGKLQGDGGWNLDKWKFLPMLHHAFETADDSIEWFVMMEADTSISWLNLLMYLKTMDPKKPYYLGAQNIIGDTTFAHGGSGIVMSRKAADTLEAARYNAGKELYDEKWEEQTALSCCGDGIVAEAFMAVEIPLTPAWPLIQGETINTVDFTGHHWCTPPITFHHVTPIEVDNHWKFEKAWTDKHGWQEPYLYRDIFEHFLAQHVSVNRTHWNNLSSREKFVRPDLADEQDKPFEELEEYEQESIESPDLCAAACMKKGDDCIQWMHTPGRCHLGREIRFGKSDERETEHWGCGWIQERIAAFKKKWEGCEVRWAG